MLNRFKISKKGITLVEILIVMTILIVLSIFAVLTIPPQMQKARDAVRKQNLDTMKKAIEEYQQDTNCYPQSIPSCQNKLINGGLNLLDNIPCDPHSRLSYTYVPEVSDCPSWYQLYANLEYTSDQIIDKVGCRNGCGPQCQFNYGTASSNQTLNPYCEEETDLESPLQYACSPSGRCEIYVDTIDSSCPDFYLSDPTCQDACSNPENRCHDARGKNN